MTVCFSEGTKRPVDRCVFEDTDLERAVAAWRSPAVRKDDSGVDGAVAGDGMGKSAMTKDDRRVTTGNGRSSDWGDPAVEPSLDEILNDPIVGLVLARDGLDRRTVERFLVAQSLRLTGGFAPSGRLCPPECFAA